MFLKLIIVVLTIYYSSQSETSVRKSSDLMNEFFRNFSKYVHSTTASSDTICIHQNDTWTKHWGTYKQFHAKKDGSNKTDDKLRFKNFVHSIYHLSISNATWNQSMNIFSDLHDYEKNNILNARHHGTKSKPINFTAFEEPKPDDLCFHKEHHYYKKIDKFIGQLKYKNRGCKPRMTIGTGNAVIGQMEKCDENATNSTIYDLDALSTNNYSNYTNYCPHPASVKIPDLKYSYYYNSCWDLRFNSKYDIGPVQNQGTSCGSCWAFAFASYFGNYIKNELGEIKRLSVQYLIDCAIGDGLYGCDGADPLAVVDWISRNRKMYFNDSYPSTEIQNKSCKIPKNGKLNVDYVTSKSNPIFWNLPSSSVIDNIRYSISQGWSVMALVAGQDLMNYAGGIMSCTCDLNNSCSGQLNHVIAIIGYTPDFWIVKNSWGVDWGEQGFGRLKMGDTCGIAQYTTAQYKN